MSMPTAEPRLLQVIDRVVAVLKAIRRGEGYWSTPADVSKRAVHPQEVLRMPSLEVTHDSSPEPPTHQMNRRFEWKMSFNVKGTAEAESGDSVTPLLRLHRDVVTAIEADVASTVAGSLGALGVIVSVGALTTDNGYFGLSGRGWFEQIFTAAIRGDWNSL